MDLIMLKPSLKCPVCKDELGYLTRNEVCSFICRECQWIFTWGRDGHLRKPVKLSNKKPQTCDCGSCQYREEQQRLKNLNRF